MHLSTKHVIFLPLLALAAARAQTPSEAPAKNSGEVVNLDALVVTGNADPKAAFDLAQGASILTDKDLLLRKSASLGETLDGLPGVSSTYYGPGAGRPLIRGLGGERVRILDNGVGALDLSNISPDHAVALEPLLVDRIEVIRGPSTLLYGSSAVGGVVNVIDNRIPQPSATPLLSGAAETRFDTAAHERTGVLSLNAGGRNLGIQISGLRTETDDVRIPGYAQTGAEAPEDQPKDLLPGSAIDTKSGSVGLSAGFAGGFVGLAASDFETEYGVPTGDDPAISIRMKQRRLDSKGELSAPFGPFKGARFRLGYGDYTHSELGGGTTVNTRFENEAWEGRVELIQETVGRLSGTLGFQAAHTDFSAEGEEVVTPPTRTRDLALFALEEYRFEPVTFQFGGRYESRRIALGEVPEGLPSFDGFSAASGETRNNDAVSVSAGAVFRPAKDYSVGLSVALSQRLPVAQELFSNGPHGGTGSYEVGTSDLGKEKSLGVDLTVRRRAGAVTGSVGVFANKFNNFIFEQRLSDDMIPEENNPDGLPVYQFVSRDALFYGGEAELTFHLVDTETDRLHLVLTSDYVHAEQTTDDEPLPRIAPWRTGVELVYERGPWDLGLGLRHTARQNRFASEETSTDRYSLLDAHVGYSFTLSKVDYDVFVKGTNLNNQEARVHSSFLKDYAPLPGRNLVFGLRARF